MSIHLGIGSFDYVFTPRNMNEKARMFVRVSM